MNKKEWISALKNYQKAFELQPDNIMAPINMAVAYRNLSNLEKSAEALDMAMKINQNDWRVWAEKGLYLQTKNLLEDAIAANKKAVELKPDDSRIWSNLAMVLIANKSLDEAKSAVEKALELNPKNQNAIFNLACIYSLMGNKESALEKLKIAIEINPKLKQNAKEDKDFDNLWEDDEFKRITS